MLEVRNVGYRPIWLYEARFVLDESKQEWYAITRREIDEIARRGTAIYWNPNER